MIFANVLKINGKSCIGFLSIASIALTQKSASSKEEKNWKILGKQINTGRHRTWICVFSETGIVYAGYETVLYAGRHRILRV